jgi:hypothetical protein
VGFPLSKVFLFFSKKVYYITNSQGILYLQGKTNQRTNQMNTYQVIIRKTGKVVATVEAASRIQAIMTQANPDKLTAVLI